MSIENKENEIRENRLREDRMMQHYRRDVIKVFAYMIACLIFLVVVWYGVLLLIDKLTQSTAGQEEIVASVDEADRLVYSESDMLEMVAAARSDAKAAGEEGLRKQIKSSFADGKPVIDLLREMYPEDLVVVSGGRYHFVPVNKELKLNTKTPDNLVILDSGEYQYVENGTVISHKGIDVSSHQGKIDWNKVAADGVEFAFIRVGFRGYGEAGKLVVDEQFVNNIEGATAAGIKVGVYMFSQAITEEELQAEANLVLEQIAPYHLDCPVVYDVEMVSGDGRMNALSLEDRTNLTLKFCQLIEKAGYKVMVYHNTEMAGVKIDIATLENYDKWYASYSSKMFYPYEYKVWQYSEKGSVSGIKGNVDMNISFGPIW